MESFTSRAFDGRALYQGHLYSETGTLVASFVQDGLVRESPQPKTLSSKL